MLLELFCDLQAHKTNRDHYFTLHSNKELSPDELMKIDGVAEVIKINRYCYNVVYGKLFKVEEVYAAIREYLMSQECHVY